MSALPQTEKPKEKVGDFMTTTVKSVDVNATIQEAAKQMDAKNISALITTENGKHIGIVTERDFTRKVVAEGLCVCRHLHILHEFVYKSRLCYIILPRTYAGHHHH